MTCKVAEFFLLLDRYFLFRMAYLLHRPVESAVKTNETTRKYINSLIIKNPFSIRLPHIGWHECLHARPHSAQTLKQSRYKYSLRFSNSETRKESCTKDWHGVEVDPAYLTT